MKKTVSLWLVLIIILSIITAGCGKVEVESVVLSDEKVTMQLKDKYDISAKISPANAAEPMLYWESSDTSVVTVKSGVVNAVGEGKATVKAFTGNGVSDVCEFNVVNILAEKITINKSKFTMMVGTKKQIEYTVVPDNITNNSIAWESSNEKVATVHNGEVSALSAGTCEITATTSNGIKAKCYLTVKIKPLGVNVNPNKVTLGTGKTVKLTATIKPENSAYNDIAWESSDEKIATVDKDGLVTGKKAGKCKIFAVTKNDCYSYANVTVTQGEVKFSGTGNKTLSDISLADGAYALTLTHKGDGTFQVIGSDGDGKIYTYVDIKGEYEGTTLYAKGKSGGIDGSMMKIAATGEWTAKIKPITYNGTDNIEGSGDCVSPMFKGTNEKKTVKLRNHEDGDFTVFLFDQSGNQIGVLCDEIDDFEGNVSVTLNKNKSYFIIVKSQGKWKVDFDNGSKVTTVKNTN